MALVITDGDVGAIGTHTAVGVTEVIASGDFLNATVQVNVSADLAEDANVYTFFSAGAISLQTAPGTKISIGVVGQGPAVIDVTCNP